MFEVLASGCVVKDDALPWEAAVLDLEKLDVFFATSNYLIVDHRVELGSEHVKVE